MEVCKEEIMVEEEATEVVEAEAAKGVVVEEAEVDMQMDLKRGSWLSEWPQRMQR